MPRHTSKILQNVKVEKKGFGMNLQGNGDKTLELNYEDWQTKYEEILQQYRQAKSDTTDLRSEL